jgi:uncharacterized protein with gpF-like domain
MQNRRTYLRVWLAAFGRFERTMRVDIARARNRYVRAAAKAYEATGDTPAYLRAAYEAELAKAIYATNSKIIPHFGAMAVRGVKSHHRVLERKRESAFFIRMMEWASTRALNNASTIADTDATIIRERISGGIAAGDGADKIARSIREVAALTIYRAATIARTETGAAANYGAIEEARQTSQEIGIVLVKEWVATNDDRTRQSHIDADGQTVELDEDFQVDGEGLDSPCDPSGSPENVINCRCAANYVEKE